MTIIPRTYPLDAELEIILKKICSAWKFTTVDDLIKDSSNHLFDDYPEEFDITELDGHKIRAYFHQGLTENADFQEELKFLFNK